MKPGDLVPDLTLYRPDGSPVRLADYLDHDYLLLVFLRHLACILCNQHLGDLDAARDRFAERGCSLLVVAQARPELLRRYLERLNWHVPFASDPQRAAYRAFGLERTYWLSFLRPAALARFFRGLFRGYGIMMPYAGEDVLQLGGDFILDRSGRVIYAHASRNPEQRPSVATLLDRIASAGPMTRDPRPDAPVVDGLPRSG